LAVGISEISDDHATFTIEEGAVPVAAGRVILIGYASVHHMAVDQGTGRFVVDFSPAVIAADDVERWISWELEVDREQARCPGDLVAEEGAWITCTAGSRDRTSSEVEVTLMEVRYIDAELTGCCATSSGVTSAGVTRFSGTRGWARWTPSSWPRPPWTRALGASVPRHDVPPGG
jgi:hypothetical protein